MSVADGRVPSAVAFVADELILLDQRKLPATVTYLKPRTLKDACGAIATLAVRGAPAIGIAAGYALAQHMHQVPAAQFTEALDQAAARLIAARPTAVNLKWAVDRLTRRALSHPTYEALLAEARAIHDEDRTMCRAIGEHGLPLITPGCRVLTHCNAGALAVSELGTATAPLYLAHEQGVSFSVFADETRPLWQGARLTAWELQTAGIDVTLICDNMAASLMAVGNIDLVITGTDRVTANGDVVNKIGTLNVAVLCKHFGVPFYVACPESTFDPHTATGAQVTIEMRDPAEILGGHAAEVRAHNPAFDVTPAELVTGLITNRGIVRQPLAKGLDACLNSPETSES